MTTLSRMRSQISSTQTFPNGLIVTSGSVGIGTNSPIQLLDVSGYINAQSIELSALWSVIQNNGYYDGAWKYRANGMAWGIGNNFGGSSNGVSIAVASTNAGGANALLTWLPVFNVTNNQRVGINAVSPSTALEVYGSITSRPASTQDAIIISGRSGGTSSYAVTFTPTTLTANQTITLPNTTGTLITTGDSGTVTNTMLAGSIANTKLLNSSITVNGTSIALGASGTITAAATNALTIGTGLSGTSYNGSSAVTIAIDSTVALRADTHYIGTTAVALNRASADLALTGIKSVTFSGSTSGTAQIIPAAVAGTGTVLTMPATTGTLITSGDTSTVTNTMLAGSIANNKLLNSSITVNGTGIALGASGTITATATNALTIGTGLSGTSYNGSSAVTIAIDSTVALRADTHYIGTTSVALNRASANLALTGISSVTLPGSTSGTVQIIPAATAGTGTVFTLPATTGTAITSGDTGTVTNTMLAGSIANTKLVNSSITVNSTSIALGGSGTITAANPNALTISTGLSGTSYDGSSAITISLNLGNANTWTATQTFSNATSAIFGSGDGTGTITGGLLRAPSGAGTNIAGGSLTIAGGASTGTGAGGAIIFQTAPAGTTGATANALAERLRIDFDGNVGIGITSPSSFNPSKSFNKVLSLASGDQALTFRSYWESGVGQYSVINSSQIATNTNASDLVFQFGGTEKIRFSSAGNVGIGTAGPGTKLEVYGSITSRPASTQDAIIISGRSGGTSSYGVTLTPATLNSNQTITIPNETGIIVTTATTLSSGTFSMLSALCKSFLFGSF